MTNSRGIDVADLRARLSELAHNLYWTWHPDVAMLFAGIDSNAWRDSNHNPVTFLQKISDETLLERAIAMSLETRISSAFHLLKNYLNDEHTWAHSHAGALFTRPIAYFSMEFGLHESLPIYSGGLGILAGDHLKSASDLGAPLIGVGLLYGRGYFHQVLDNDGYQNERYPPVNRNQLPMRKLYNRDGSEVRVTIRLDHRHIQACVWEVVVGRIRLYLLDADVPENTTDDRTITTQLYGGDERVRIAQETLLGIGGFSLLETLGVKPGVIHLNEGHCAFAILEAVRQRMAEDGLGFIEAFREIKSCTVFTTHTPVEAGHDRFSAALMEEHLGWMREQLGLTQREFMALGRVNPLNDNETFCMTVLALKGSVKRNGVSHLHGRVSRKMWNGLFPDRPEDEVPIGHITNGVHVLSWLAPPMNQLLQRYTQREWEKHMCFPDAWSGIERINDQELWETHTILRHRLIEYVRRRIRETALGRGDRQTAEGAVSLLNPNILTIGFARRFATYKRAWLLFHERERLLRLLADAKHPVQFIFAGKAHPRDEAGKKIIREIVQFSRLPEVNGRVVFVEDYDYSVARHLVQGVDLWINNPIRPLEACGTSGQKVLLNGGLNLSVLDGWWAEAYDGKNGFAIGDGRVHANEKVQNERDAKALFDTLENEVIPLFYEQDEYNVPREWTRRMKHAILTLAWRFNADRMVMDYVTQCYLHAGGGVSAELK
ncbi:MAG: Glycogen phosphorylase [Myxococcota bacterium]|nr:Glycogen phosphorylase [Myxococcota bacterium]